MTRFPSEDDLSELQAYADKGPSVSRAACGRVVESLRQRKLMGPWRIELTEVHPTEEDQDQSILKGRVIMERLPGHFDLRIWCMGQLVFFLTSNPRGIDDVPQSIGDVHMFMSMIDDEMPLVALLRDANGS